MKRERLAKGSINRIDGVSPDVIVLVGLQPLDVGLILTFALSRLLGLTGCEGEVGTRSPAEARLCHGCAILFHHFALYRHRGGVGANNV